MPRLLILTPLFAFGCAVGDVEPAADAADVRLDGGLVGTNGGGTPTGGQTPTGAPEVGPLDPGDAEVFGPAPDQGAPPLDMGAQPPPPDACAPTAWYADGDGDGMGAGEPQMACEAPPGHVDVGGDCDDENAQAAPGNPEACNGFDDDCDGVIDQGAGCPCALETYGAHAYLVCADERSWPDADAACRQVGYILATIDDAQEDAFLFGEIDSRGFDDTWVGLNDRQQEGQWGWISGAPLIYTHWDEGEPNDGGGEDCGLVMTSRGRAAEWDDRPCDGRRPYLCESP